MIASCGKATTREHRALNARRARARELWHERGHAVHVVRPEGELRVRDAGGG
jgi:hypothetical protein